MQEKAMHNNDTAGGKMIKFHLEEMSSLHITYPFEDDSSPAKMMLPRQRARGRAGP